MALISEPYFFSRGEQMSFTDFRSFFSTGPTNRNYSLRFYKKRIRQAKRNKTNPVGDRRSKKETEKEKMKKKKEKEKRKQEKRK